MFRLLFDLLLMVVVITVVKSIIGIVLRGFGDAMRSTSSNAPRPSPPQTGQVPLTGELKKDPVCGTYISTATSLKEKVGSEVYHFCSQECRDKYVASLAH